MIDDYTIVKELIRKMEAQLPIPARPTGAFLRAMRDRGVKVATNQELQIQNVLYLGDEGGIACNVTPSRDAREVQIVSITHLEIDPNHPLAPEIRAYQVERTRKIARSGGLRRPVVTTIKPRRKRKR